MKISFRGWITALILSLLVLWSAGRGCAAAPKASSEPASDLLLKVSGNGRYLVDQKGNPFLVVGDSPWSLIVQLNEKDRETYLADRQKRGFNSLIVNLLEHKFTTRAPNTLTGLAPFKTPGDFSTPNDAYFDFAHQVVEQAGEHGMVVWLAPAYLGYGGGDEGFFREIKAGGREKLRAYGTYIGKRFKDLPNIVWILGGDYTPEKPDQWVVNELATAIREEDPTHVMTAHHSPESSAVTAFGEQEWLAINTVYGYEKTLYRPLLAQYVRKPVHPFVLLETTYEDEHDSTPDLIRRQAYWAMLAGACGQFFGNNPIWHFDGPTLFPFKLPWRQALGAAGSRDMALLRELFIHLPWQELAPEVNHSILTEGYGSDTATALTASTADGRLSITYIPSTGKGVRELTVALDGFAKPISARWYNPTNGHFVEIDGSPYAHHGTQRLRSPDDNGTGANDWVLVLDAR
ncbi:MAG: DUF4038 domain-containing protein [Terriglobia bacterium]|jgi:hypothetical protein